MSTPPYSITQLQADVGQLRGQVSLLDEAHTVNDGGSTPNTPSPGAYTMYSSAGQPNFVNPSGLTMGVVGAQTSWTPNNTVTGTGLGNLASWSIPAGDGTANAIYETEVWGNGVQGSNNQTLQFAVILGGTTMSSVLYGTTAMPASGIFRWRAQTRVIVVTTGVTGTWQSYINTTYSQFNTTVSSSNGNTNAAFSCEATGVTTKDTTIAQTFGLSAAWGGTAGSPTISSQRAVAKRIC